MLNNAYANIVNILNNYGFSIKIMIQFKLSPLFFCLLLALQAHSSLDLGWGLYRWVSQDKCKFQPRSPTTIILSHPQSMGLTLQISTPQPIIQVYNSYNLSQYKVGGNTPQNNKIILISIGRRQVLQFHHIKQFTLKIQCSSPQCKHDHDSILRQLKSKQQLSKICKLIQQQQYKCNTQILTLSLSITLPIHKNIKNSVHKLDIHQQYQYHIEHVREFMKLYNISNDSTNTNTKQEVVQHAISQLINQICLYRYEGDGEYYLGFCQKNKDGKYRYNFKLAAFSIYLLADYYHALAKTIYTDFFTLTQLYLLYNTHIDSQVLPLPQHIQVFTRFGTVLQLQNQAQLLNSMFVTPMLNQLGTLHEQLNYRQAKKLHPLLLKMLTQKWSSSSSLRALKSYYDQSFTQDFHYHQYGQQLEQASAKMAWIYKVIDTYTGILIKHHSFYMPVQQTKQHLQQHFTLLNIYRVYTNDDGNAKTGKYSDIINVGESLKLYSKYYGYDSLLPYVYGLGKIYPQATVKQLQTQYGLKSSNQKQYKSGYRYRGDIHAYFNTKIISGLMYRVDEDKSMPALKKKQILGALTKLAVAFGNKVMNDYKKEGKIYTSWTPEGKGKESCGWGKIVAVLMLKWI